MKKGVPSAFKSKKGYFIITPELKILAKYRLKAAANNDLPKFNETYLYCLSIVTAEQYEELKKSVTILKGQNKNETFKYYAYD